MFFSQKYGTRPITYADIGTLPYIEATLLEIQRIANIGIVPGIKCIDQSMKPSFETSYYTTGQPYKLKPYVWNFNSEYSLYLDCSHTFKRGC